MALCRGVVLWSLLMLAGLTTVAGAGCDSLGMMNCAVHAKGYLRVELGETAQILVSLEVQHRAHFCRNFTSIFENCVNPKRGDCPEPAETLLDAVQKAGELACDEYAGVAGLDECVRQPELKRRVKRCTLRALSYAPDFKWRYNEAMACRVGNELLDCVDDAMKDAHCEPSAAKWIRDINTRIFKPFADLINCDIIEVPDWMKARQLEITTTTALGMRAGCDWEGILKCAIEAKDYLDVELGEAAQVMSSLDAKQRMLFCGNFTGIFKNCVNPKRGKCATPLEALLDGVEEGGEFACEHHAKVPWLNECLSKPQLKWRLAKCNREAFHAAAPLFIRLYSEEEACRIGNRLMCCVDEALRDAGCKPCAARWIREVNTKMFQPFADEVHCDIKQAPDWMGALNLQNDWTTIKITGEKDGIPSWKIILVSGLAGLLVIVTALVCCCCWIRHRRSRDPHSQEEEKKPKMADEGDVLTTDKEKEIEAFSNPVYTVPTGQFPPEYKEAVAAPPEYSSLQAEAK